MLSDTNKLFIRYFDLGVFDGGEIDLMINLLSKFQVDYEIYGFEANPSLAKKLITKYKKKRIKWYIILTFFSLIIFLTYP